MPNNQQAIEAKVASIASKQAQAAELREQMSFSLKIQSLFPNAFEGNGKVTITPNMKKGKIVMGPSEHPISCILIDASGNKHSMTVEQYLALYPDKYNQQQTLFVKRHWLKP